MNQAGRVIARLRLEVDQRLRSRPFFARAIAGLLSCREYLDLVGQVGVLVERSDDLAGLARSDVSALRELERVTQSEVAAWPALDLFRATARSLPERIVSAYALDVCVSVVGTSWTKQVADRLSGRWPSSLLVELSRRGPERASTVQERLEHESKEDIDLVHGFAELARGAVLGLATHLDRSWPPPIGSMNLYSRRN